MDTEPGLIEALPPTRRFRRCVLHIGTEKTGTTSVQVFLAANRSALLREGVFVPLSMARETGGGNHERVTTFAMDENRLNDDLRVAAGIRSEAEVLRHRATVVMGLRTEIARLPAWLSPDQATLLLSNEHCHSRLHTVQEVERVAALVRPLAQRVEVLVYLRPQHELAASLYDQAMKSGYADIALVPDFSGRTQRVAHRGYFDYAQLLDRWAAVFGQDAITVRIFSAADLTEGNVVQDVVCWLGLHRGTFSFAPHSNASLDAAHQVAMNAVNRLAKQRGAPLPPAVRHGLIGQFERASSGAGLLPARADAEAFFESFAESNARVRRTWFPGRARLFEVDFSRFPERPDQPDEALALAAAVVTQQETINALRARLREAGIAPPA